MRTLLAALLVVVLAACRDSTGPDSGLVGTYALETVNGQPLPFEIFGVAIVSASLTLRADRTYSTTSELSVHDPFTGAVTSETQTEDGTWTRRGDTLRTVSTGGDVVEATISGNTLTADNGTYTAVFRKQ